MNPLVLKTLTSDKYLSEDYKKDIKNPNFENKGRVHNWRNYIDDEIKSLWYLLSEDAKLIAYIQAKRSAYNEEWD